MKSKKEDRLVVKVFGNEKNYFHFQLSLSHDPNMVKRLLNIHQPNGLKTKISKKQRRIKVSKIISKIFYFFFLKLVA